MDEMLAVVAPADSFIFFFICKKLNNNGYHKDVSWWHSYIQCSSIIAFHHHRGTHYHLHLQVYQVKINLLFLFPVFQVYNIPKYVHKLCKEKRLIVHTFWNWVLENSKPTYMQRYNYKWSSKENYAQHS